MITATSYNNSLVPSDLDVNMARESSRVLGDLHLKSDEALEMQIAGKLITLSAGVRRILMETLHDVALGKSVAVIPLEEEATPNEAADLLNVSRGFVMKLIEAGEIPARKVGSHHRLRVVDVLEYRRKNDEGRRQALSELVAQAQELDMGY